MSTLSQIAASLSPRQQEGLQILMREGRPLRNDDFVQKGVRSSGGWSKALGLLKKPDKHPKSLLAKGLVSVNDKKEYTITQLGLEVAEALGYVTPVVRAKDPVKPEEKPESASTKAVPTVDGKAVPVLAVDLEAIFANNKLGPTQKAQLVSARIGQGAFRYNVLMKWDGSCSVTGCSTLAAIRASHIKPWCKSSDDARLDPNNGLPLVATLDALFDAGLISFDFSGKLIVSRLLHPKEEEFFGIIGMSLRKTPSQATVRYLEYHRNNRFQG